MRRFTAAILATVALYGCGGKADTSEAASTLQDVIGYANDGQFGRMYELLIPGQQALISAAEFQACAVQQYAKMDGVMEEYEETITIPGTNIQMEATALTIFVEQDGVTATQTLHMVQLGEEWRWVSANPSKYQGDCA